MVLNVLKCRLSRKRHCALVFTATVVLLLVLFARPSVVTPPSVSKSKPNLAATCCGNSSEKSVRKAMGTPESESELEFPWLSEQQDDPELNSWLSSAVSKCGGRVVGYANQFAILHGITVTKAFAEGKRKGGEPIKEVMNQPEEDEYLKTVKGFLQLDCADALPLYSFVPTENPFNSLLNSITQSAAQPPTVKLDVETKPTLLVQRREYVNMYHTMTDWYNAYLMMVAFKLHPRDVQVVFLDAHPKGILDDTWATLFNSFVRLKELPERVNFSSLVLTTWGYQSPLSKFNGNRMPMVESFRHFVLARHALGDLVSRPLDCSKVVVTLILRKRYISHPRNPTGGKIERRFFNEQEMIELLKNEFVTKGKLLEVNTVQLETMSVLDQLKLIARSDILIGMHGAGLTLSLFLPPHAGLIELLPSYFGAAPHFHCVANWRRLTYLSWQNRAGENEKADSQTRIPPEILRSLVNEMLNKLQCQK